MRETGIVRRIDELGRVVIPKEIRKTQRIRTGDSLEIYSHQVNTFYQGFIYIRVIRVIIVIV